MRGARRGLLTGPAAPGVRIHQGPQRPLSELRQLLLSSQPPAGLFPAHDRLPEILRQATSGRQETSDSGPWLKNSTGLSNFPSTKWWCSARSPHLSSLSPSQLPQPRLPSSPTHGQCLNQILAHLILPWLLLGGLGVTRQERGLGKVVQGPGSLLGWVSGGWGWGVQVRGQAQEF